MGDLFEFISASDLLQAKETFHNQYVSSGVAQIAGKSNEDTFSIYEHERQAIAFGVFDGHGGSYGSSICSESFCKGCLATADSMIQDFKAYNHFTDNTTLEVETYDAFLCESVRQEAAAISDEMQRQGNSGTTCNALFIKVEGENSIRLYCANVGDSRSLLIRDDSILYLSEDHVLSLPRELKRIKQRKTATWFPLPADPRQLECNTGSFMGESRERVYPSSVRLRRAMHVVSQVNYELPLLGMFQEADNCVEETCDHSEVPRLNLNTTIDSFDLSQQRDIAWEKSELVEGIHSLLTETHQIFETTLVSYWSASGKDRGRRGPVLRLAISDDDEVREVPRQDLVGRCFRSRSIVQGVASELCCGGEQVNSGKARNDMIDVVCIPLRNNSRRRVLGVLQVVGKASNPRFTQAEVIHLNSMCEKMAAPLSRAPSPDFDGELWQLGESVVEVANEFENGSCGSVDNPKGHAENAAEKRDNMIFQENEHGLHAQTTKDKEISLQHSRSFIARRRGKCAHKEGPLALFSRHNVSLTMTRSLGDRYGPRSCVAVPDITAITIEPGDSVRVVIATDGLWNAFGAIEVAAIVGKIRDSGQAASFLAKQALARHKAAHRRIDDITCIVVDISTKGSSPRGVKSAIDKVASLPSPPPAAVPAAPAKPPPPLEATEVLLALPTAGADTTAALQTISAPRDNTKGIVNGGSGCGCIIH